MNYINIYLSIFFITLINFSIQAQDIDYSVNEVILSKLPENVQIIGLGDPTHQESTITKYRIDLIKKLIEEKEFGIIAIEGNIYELYKGYQNFIKSNNISDIEKAMYSQLNFAEMEPLYEYVYQQNQKGNPVIITGFDVTFSGSTFVENMKNDLKNIHFLNDKEKQDFIKYLEKASNSNASALFRNNKKVKSKIAYYSKLILSQYIPKSESDYFFEQALKNFVFRFDTDQTDTWDNLRDMGMSLNIAFLNKVYNNKKIILFGSNSHLYKNPKEINESFFQNNRKTFGDELNQNYQDKYYFIAYSAISGRKLNTFFKPVDLPELNENSIEYQSKKSNSIYPLYLNKHNSKEEKTYCRFMGHSFLEMNIWSVMDGLVLIENIVPTKIKKL